MSAEVYANGNAIAGKATGGKVIAAFPDVCLTPPSPPAGPIPVPYPDTSFSKDMQKGSKTVMIKGKEVMLKDQSFYKTSPLGDEAATRGLGAGVVTHVITGKTYFNAWSMDVQFEGQNVDRHIDLTTSNHASYPGNSAPMTNLEKLALDRIKDNKCPCCDKTDCPAAFAPGDQPLSFNDWYGLNDTADGSAPAADGSNLKPEAAARRAEVDRIKKRKAGGCCTGKLFPEAPCDVFRETTQAQRDAVIAGWSRRKRKKWQENNGIKSEAEVTAALTVNGVPPTQRQVELARQGNHLTPKGAGGCPTGPGNIQANGKLCQACQDDDQNVFGDWQKTRTYRP